MLKTIFLGTPALAVPFLEKLKNVSRVEAVVTTPDRPAGRGYEVKPPIVKAAGQRLGIPVHQPVTLKDPAATTLFRGFGADVGIVVAYGKLLPQDVLASTKHGFLNVHFSLLPKYRGAGPIQWALLNGESETGVTLFWLDPGMDTGPIFVQKRLAIQPDDDADILRNKLVVLGVSALEEALVRIETGDIARIPQSGPSSLAPLLKKEDGRIAWDKPATSILNQLRGLTPWPGLFFGRVKVLKGRALSDDKKGVPGTVVSLVSGEGPVVRCGVGSFQLLEVQPEGKKPMPAWNWWQGAHLNVGDRITEL